MEDDWVYIHNDGAAFSAARTTAFVVVDAEREGAADAKVEDVAGDTTAESEAYGDLPSIDGDGIAATTFHAREYHNIEFDDACFRHMYISDEGIHGCEALNGNGGTKSNSPKLLQCIYDNYKLYDKQYGNIYINTGGRHEGTVVHGSNDGTYTGGGRSGAAHGGNGSTKSNLLMSLQTIYDNYKLYDKQYGNIYINTGGKHEGTVDHGSNDGTHTGGGRAGAAHGGNGSTKSNSPVSLQTIYDNYKLYDKQYGNIYINTGGRHEGIVANGGNDGTHTGGGRAGAAHNGNGGTKSNSPNSLQSIYDNYKLDDKQYGNIYINTGGRHEGTVAHGSNDGIRTEGGHAGVAHGGNDSTKSNSPVSLQSIYDNYKLYDKHYGNIYINTGGRHEGTVAHGSNDGTHTRGGHAGAAHGGNGSTKSITAKMIPCAHDNTEFYDTYYGGMYISNESEPGDEADSICSDIESNSSQELPSTYNYNDFDDMLPSACYDTEFYGAYCGDMYISNESEHGDEADSICSDIESNSPQELPSTYDYNDFDDMLPSPYYDTEFYGAYCGDMYINNEGRHDGVGCGGGNDGTKSNSAMARSSDRSPARVVRTASAVDGWGGHVVLIPAARRRTADMYGTPLVYGYGYPLDGHVPLFMSMMPSYSYVTMYADANLHVHSLHPYSYIVQL